MRNVAIADDDTGVPRADDMRAAHRPRTMIGILDSIHEGRRPGRTRAEIDTELGTERDSWDR